MEVAQRLIARHALRDGEEVGASECFGLSDAACEEKFAEFWKCGSSSWIDAVAVRFSVPDGLFVELNALVYGFTEDHCTEPAVAYG
jgi:hypothetical protein